MESLDFSIYIHEWLGRSPYSKKVLGSNQLAVLSLHVLPVPEWGSSAVGFPQPKEMQFRSAGFY